MQPNALLIRQNFIVCKKRVLQGLSSRLASDEITTHGYRALTIAKCTTVMTVVLMVTSGLGSSFD
jgi:hypothetical protein